MIVPAAVRSRFDASSAALTEVSRRVREAVLSHCEAHGFAFVGRAKTLDSLAEKIETGRYEKWSDLDDLFACAVVIPTLAYEEAVIMFLRSAFKEIALRQRGSTQKAPDTFRFEATRFVGRLRAPEGVPEAEAIYQISFEVQIRSAFEHAWSVATHSLVYKAAQVDWRRLRLASNLKASVEQLDSLILAFDDSAKYIVSHEWPEVRAQITIAAFFQQRVESGLIPAELLFRPLFI